MRLRAPSVAQATLRDFSLWLAESPAHGDAFDAVARQFEDSAVPEGRVLRLPRRSIRRRLAWAAAAAACLALAMVWLVPRGESYQTAIGEQLAVRLGDGSEVRLNTDSELRVRLTERYRRVTLERGEAFFNVARDVARPFVVRAGEATVTAVGTAFNVHRSAQGVRVVLADGRVRVSAGEEYDLAPGQALLIGASGTERWQVSADLIAPWRRHMLIYADVRLEDLAADLDRYMAARITVDEALRDARVSAVLRIDARDAMLDALATTLDMHWSEIEPGHILLYARPGRAS